MPRNGGRSTVAVLLLVAWMLGCAAQTPRRGSSSEVAAIEAVIAADERLAGARNHAPEGSSLADAIREYVSGLDSLDFAGCPKAFRDAFRRHRDAWERSIPLFDPFDELRGEMHDLFEQIRQHDGPSRSRLEATEEEIWATWAEVEAAAHRAGASLEVD